MFHLVISTGVIAKLNERGVAMVVASEPTVDPGEALVRLVGGKSIRNSRHGASFIGPAQFPESVCQSAST